MKIYNYEYRHVNESCLGAFDDFTEESDLDYLGVDFHENGSFSVRYNRVIDNIVVCTVSVTYNDENFGTDVIIRVIKRTKPVIFNFEEMMTYETRIETKEDSRNVKKESRTN